MLKRAHFLTLKNHHDASSHSLFHFPPPCSIGRFTFINSCARSTRHTGRPALTDALKKGGYTLFFRHIATDQSKGDQNKPVVADCTTQRNLSREGRIEARAISQTFDNLQIPVGQVLASPYCRAVEMARLGFARAEASDALIEQKPQNDTTAKIVEAGLRPLLADAPIAGTNTVLVSHGFNLRSISGFALAEGEAAVYLPDGKGGFNLVARVLTAKWSSLAP